MRLLKEDLCCQKSRGPATPGHQRTPASGGRPKERRPEKETGLETKRKLHSSGILEKDSVKRRNQPTIISNAAELLNIARDKNSLLDQAYRSQMTLGNSSFILRGQQERMYRSDILFFFQELNSEEEGTSYSQMELQYPRRSFSVAINKIYLYICQERG